MALSDNIRAKVFFRDKGICAFSGLSLWILDYGTPIWHHDWVDHIKPVSRGGDGALDNLVCASFFHNGKKRNNGADNSYLFRDGEPTDLFFWNHGEVSSEQADLIRRHRALKESDWYLNRALSRVMIALRNEWNVVVAVRTPEYWLSAAAKSFEGWRRHGGDASVEAFDRRGLVKYPDAPDVQIMLAMSTAREGELPALYRQLAHHSMPMRIASMRSRKLTDWTQSWLLFEGPRRAGIQLSRFARCCV